MNQDQIQSGIRTALKIGGTYLAAKGHSQIAALFGDSNFIDLAVQAGGGLAALVGFILSWKTHSSTTTTPAK